MNIFLYLLLFAGVFSLYTSITLLRNRKDLTGLYVPEGYSENYRSKVSICIPARNEENKIAPCVESACNQSYYPMEVIVLDDNSDDKTPDILQNLHQKFSDILLVKQGEQKPPEWLGKPWACHQLAKYADGEILVFIDADTTLEPDFTKKAIAEFTTRNLDFATVWPSQTLETFWERLLIPMVYHALLTLLPAIYTTRAPRWMPSALKARFQPLFAAAAGQCMIFSRPAYQKIGGHQSVKDKVVEDVELAKNILLEGLNMRMYHGMGSIRCRMYESESEIRSGFRKNFLAGFSYNVPLFIGAALLHIIVYLLPYFTFFLGIIHQNGFIFLLSTFVITTVYFQRIVIARWFKWNMLYGLLHPVGVLWFQYLGLLSLNDNFSESDIYWKNRKL